MLRIIRGDIYIECKVAAFLNRDKFSPKSIKRYFVLYVKTLILDFQGENTRLSSCT
jgi:hypothetical protein